MLGPLLFILYVNALEVGGRFIKFADDVKLVRVVSEFKFKFKFKIIYFGIYYNSRTHID